MAALAVAISMVLAYPVFTSLPDVNAAPATDRGKSPAAWSSAKKPPVYSYRVKKVRVPAPPRVQPVKREAMKLLGISYVWGGTTPSGFDCSGFTGYVLRKVGVHVGRDTYAQIGAGTSVPHVSMARAGDLLFPSTGHVMLHVGGGMAAHSPRRGTVSGLVPVSSRSYIAIRRPPGAWKEMRPRTRTKRVLVRVRVSDRFQHNLMPVR